MGWRVRRAGPDDSGALARLRWLFRAEMGQASEPLADFVARAEGWMAPRLGAGGRWMAWLVVDDDGGPVGCGWLQLIEKVPNPGTEEELHGYVTSLFVVPELRGGGAGSALLSAALDACREAEVDSVILWPTSRSRSLYERFGFRDGGEVMVLRLGTGRALP